ncbi:guanine nucleotide binding protein, alpha subunit [Neocallimastix lanati (nom. inval.)]|jgi:GTPase SAR1 family protein|uniref:Guanine nucleotide binding protein, alpha subunit n=1 Tax=Neocallimastix californiae TaxID=1754190 RepID=A0A1Y2E9V4_9FUNG|nr:guanine nucleotide binding protein, alpha subunit [Neocallimastix sp. JGI-2020a]ORY68026.1 guanine nucleotide binding protein, alpha subunit [Neocallimastix californiae]|eukprot:ORY68026.1 guanine nucleotide binding protein, alpha subunit [Neocallimastix californiae]
MGLCLSTADVNEKTKIIDRELRADKNKRKGEIKILLLGGSESGKSTVLKQMRILNQKNFKPQERIQYRIVIYMNITQTAKSLIELAEYMKIPINNDTAVNIIKKFNASIDKDSPIPIEYFEALIKIRDCLKDKSNFFSSSDYKVKMDDSSRYFIKNIDRISCTDYIPTDQDILRCRVRTTGITQTIFKVNELLYRVVDVGGQRTERKKWIHCFDDVNAIIFLVAISGYDQTLWEDNKTNQMYEALLLFDSICNSRWFINTPIILFLNKIDIFKKKIKYSPVSNYFPDYTGNNDNYDETSVYFKNRFESLQRNKRQPLYTHYTFATDTTYMREIMNMIHSGIIKSNLKRTTIL